MEKIELQIHDVALVKYEAKGPFKEPDHEVQMDIHTTFKLEGNGRMVQVQVGVDFFYPDDKSKKIVLSGLVITGFSLTGEQLPEDLTKYDIPDPYLITMLSIGISHARALLLTQTKASSVMGFVVPIVNPTAIFNRMKAASTKAAEVKT